MMKMTAVICNGNIPCCEKSSCRYLGKGECFHTTNLEYAKNEPENRKMITLDNGSLWEVEDGKTE